MSMRPWWIEHDEHAAPSEHNFAFSEAFSPAMRLLLEDVENEFESLGGGALAWPNPHYDRDPTPEEYSRNADPGKYRILVDRVQAWANVLVSRGWANKESMASWADLRLIRQYEELVLAPVAPGAVPLVFAITGDDPGIGHSVVVGAGDPAIVVGDPRGCGCDACDDGSMQLLEDLDQWVLSVVDGSLRVEGGSEAPTIRTSFVTSTIAGTPEEKHRGAPTSFTAGPWADGWVPRRIPTPLPTGLRPGNGAPSTQETEP